MTLFSYGLWELIETGGPAVLPLFAVSGVLFTLSIEKALVLWSEKRVTDEELSRVLKGASGPAFEGLKERGACLARLVYRVGENQESVDAVLLDERARLHARLPWLGILTSVAPLLGLMGTVQGMIVTFETITLTGSSDPALLSRGISEALISTQLGLAVAVPGLLAHVFLVSRAERAEARLDIWAIRLTNREEALA